MSTPTTMTARITAWIGVASAMATILMTFLNYHVKKSIDEEAMQLNRRKQEFEEAVRMKTQELEESKDNIARYRFVFDILSNISNKSDQERTVLVNVARIALKPNEEAKLFASMASSPNLDVAQVGEIGKATIATEKKSITKARAKEREGFIALVNGDYPAAARAFEEAENAYNSYHQVYELARLVRQRMSDLRHPDKRKQVFQLIVSDYSYGAPEDLLEKVEDLSK